MYLPKEIELSTCKKYQISKNFKEVMAFAVLGYQRYFEQPNNEPSATGAKKRTSMGKIVLP